MKDPTIGQMTGLFKKPGGVFVWIGIIGAILGSLAGVVAVECQDICGTVH